MSVGAPAVTDDPHLGSIVDRCRSQCSPRCEWLAAPLHYHHKEDELSYVVNGRLGVLLGEEVVIAHPGTWVFKPRHQWHTFWNDGDEPCEIVEIISPAGFENYFRDVAASWGNVKRLGEINQKYSLEMRFDSVPELCRRFSVTFPSLEDAQRPVS